MPTAAQWTWPDTLDRIIRDEADAAGVPLDLAYTFIAVESSFNPLIHVDNALEDSVGLLQLNRRGGQGTGYTVAQLQDPATNLRIGLPYIRRAFETSWAAGISPATFIYLVAIRSGHPGQVEENDYRIVNIKNAWMIFYPAVGASLQGPAPASTPSPPPTNASSPGLAANVGAALLFPILVPAAVAYAATVTAWDALGPLAPVLSRKALFRTVFGRQESTFDGRGRRGPEGGAEEVRRALSGRPGYWRNGRFVYS